MKNARATGWVLLIAALGAAGYYGWHRYGGAPIIAADAQKPASPARSAVPVRTAPVETADFPVYLTGLGTVQGFNTVQVRTRVDGQINRIDFQEGQLVKAGDTLVLAAGNYGITAGGADTGDVPGLPIFNLNGTVTITEAAGRGYVTAWPCGQPRPVASFLNFVRGVDQANLTPVRIGDDGTVCLFVNEGTEVVADLNGYYTLAA